MSVHIPIYKRILYNSLETPDEGQSRNESFAQKLQTAPVHLHKELEKMPTVQAPERHTKSAPLVPVTSLRRVQANFQSRGQVIPRLLNSAPLISFTKSNAEYQSERWKEREMNLTQSRTLKRTSNIIAHRQDRGYYISGSRLPLLNRYDIEEEELIRLRMLAHSRAEKSTRASSANSSTFQRKLSSGVSPSGQNCSPVPPSTAPGSGKQTLMPLGRKNNIKERREKQRELQRKKEREMEKRLQERAEFEKEMEERYKPKKPIQKNMIFVTESNNSNEKQRVFLTESDFMEDGEKGNVYTFINESQRNAFTSIFNDIDKNNDGKVDMDELKQKLFPLVSKKNLKYLLQVFDLNQDNTVDVREFVTVCALNDKLCGIRTETETTSLALDLERLAQHITIYKELFNVVDEDGDGRVQSEEILLMVTTAIEGESKIDQEESSRVLDSVEKDENGYIDFVSFLSYIPFFMGLLKAIMDSPLSIATLEKARDKVTRKYSKAINHSPESKS